MVAALTSERERRRWHGQIPGEGWHSDGGAVGKAMGGLLMGSFEGRTEEGKRTEALRRRAPPFLSGIAGSRGRGETGVRVTRGGRRSTRRGEAWSQPIGYSEGGAACPHWGGVGVSDAQDLAGHEREREREEARGAWAGPEKKEAWAEPEGTGSFFISSNEFQTSLNGIDQKVALLSSKNSK
jgi:hypothetical protein